MPPKKTKTSHEIAVRNEEVNAFRETKVGITKQYEEELCRIPVDQAAITALTYKFVIEICDLSEIT